MATVMSPNAEVRLDEGAEPGADLIVRRAAPPGSANEKYLPRISGLLLVIAAGVLIAFCFFASSICITVALAAFLSILVDPIVISLERVRIPRALAAGLLLIAGMALLGFGGYKLYGKASDLAEVLPGYAGQLQQVLAPLNRKIEKMKQSAGSLGNDGAQKKVPEVQVRETVSWPSYLVRGVGSVWGALIIAGVVPFLMFFMLTRKEHISGRLLEILGERIDVPNFAHRVNEMVRGYVVGNLIIGSVMSMCTVLMLLALHMKGAISIGIASGFLNLIPFLGLLLALALPITAALLQYVGPSAYFVIVGTILLLHFFSANLLVPRFVGTRVSIGPVVATIGMLFWGWLWGVMGLLLAVPLTAFVKLVADTHPSLQHVSNILAVKPRPVAWWVQYSESKMRGAIPYLRQRWRGGRPQSAH
jgi:predicted PurR-regulated permease PerM